MQPGFQILTRSPAHLEIWLYYPSTSKARAQVSGNLIVQHEPMRACPVIGFGVLLSECAMVRKDSHWTECSCCCNSGQEYAEGDGLWNCCRQSEAPLQAASCGLPTPDGHAAGRWTAC